MHFQMRRLKHCVKKIQTKKKKKDLKKIKSGLDEYPITVNVYAINGEDKKLLWSGSQRNLFSKYASNRKKSMQEIQEAVKDYIK